MWRFPIDLKYVGLTEDSDSFKNIDITKEVQLPIGNHCGAFGVERKHDVHAGIDLYCPEGTVVRAVDDGEVVHIRPFTGEIADCPWWNDTWAISVMHKDGIVVYGEIFKPTLEVGDFVERGNPIAIVKQVLKVDKGRPMSMLHFAMHSHDVLSNRTWKIGLPQAHGLLDPTNRLIRSEK